jgi:hypothetical protein
MVTAEDDDNGRVGTHCRRWTLGPTPLSAPELIVFGSPVRLTAREIAMNDTRWRSWPIVAGCRGCGFNEERDGLAHSTT